MQEFTVRYLKERDIRRVIACIRAVHGEAYPRKDMYNPHWFRAQLRRANFIFGVAVRTDGEVVGYSALRHAPKGYYELCEAVVHPVAAQIHGIFECMIGFLVERARTSKARGLYSLSVTSCGTQQVVNARFGLKDAALLLAYMPKTLACRAVHCGPPNQAESCLTQICLFQHMPRRSVFVPARHADVAEALYENVCVSRKVRTRVGREEPLPDEPSIVTLRPSPPYGRALLRLDRLGRDLMERLREDREYLTREGYRVIYLDIPLEDKGAVSVCERAEDLGFFFAGILPSFPIYDVLRLQFLSVPFSPDLLRIESPFGRQLLAHVASEWHRASRPSRQRSDGTK